MTSEAMTTTISALPQLSGAESALAVVAHPDDESFGLGGVLLCLIGLGVDVRLLCLTAGEASTVGAASTLADTRREELVEAAKRLGLRSTKLLGFPDGGLAATPHSVLEAAVESEIGAADLVIVFEPDGVTGHRDHIAATAAAEAVADRRGLLSLEWGLGKVVADPLRAEFGAPFVAFEAMGRWPVELTVDRAGQKVAISCHRSQDPENLVLARRLSLEADSELVRPRSAPFPERLTRFALLASGLVEADRSHRARLRLLQLLIGFACGDSWPIGFRGALARTAGAGSNLLLATSTWRLSAHGASPVSPPVLPDCAWGAWATVDGTLVSSFAKSPDDQRGLGEESILLPRGGGKLFSGQQQEERVEAVGPSAIFLLLEVLAHSS